MATIPTSSSIAFRVNFGILPTNRNQLFGSSALNWASFKSVFHDSELRQSVVNIFKKNNDKCISF